MTVLRLSIILLLQWLVLASGITQKNSSPLRYEQTFQLKRNMVLVEASVNHQTGYFILDTGYSNLGLNDRYFETHSAKSVVYGLSGQAQKTASTPATLVLGPWKINLLAYHLDLTAIEKQLELPILGLIGKKALEKFEIELDFKSTQIIFYLLDRKGQLQTTRKAYDPAMVVPISIQAHLPILTVQIGEHTYHMGIDTGAGVNLLDIQHEAIYLNQGQIQQSRLISLQQNTRHESRKLISVSVSCSNRQTAPIPILFHDLDAFNRELPGKDIDGFLGFSFISQQRISLNYKQKKLSFWLPSSSQESYYDIGSPITDQQK